MKKRGIVWNELAWWIIALAVLAMIVIGIWALRDQGFDLLDKIKDLFRFGEFS